MRTVNGLHHVTAISGPAQENLDFYSGTLGMRLVKKSVNQDDVGTYHLFYADASGTPGTDLTFFPWAAQPRARPGHGMAPEVSLAVPAGTLDFWAPRLLEGGAQVGQIQTRFGQSALPFRDPHGLGLALVEADDLHQRDFQPWSSSPVAVDHQIRGLHAARMTVRDLSASASFLTEQLGFQRTSSEADFHRFEVAGGGSGRHLDLIEDRDGARGSYGVGAIHHLAWRVDDEQHELAIRSQVSTRVDPTPVIDRFWFQSVYFREPGGVLFELATDGPGFSVDEDPDHLGESLVLPPWLESARSEIAAALPPLKALPSRSRSD